MTFTMYSVFYSVLIQSSYFLPPSFLIAQAVIVWGSFVYVRSSGSFCRYIGVLGFYSSGDIAFFGLLLQISRVLVSYLAKANGLEVVDIRTDGAPGS